MGNAKICKPEKQFEMRDGACKAHAEIVNLI